MDFVRSKSLTSQMDMPMEQAGVPIIRKEALHLIGMIVEQTEQERLLLVEEDINNNALGLEDGVANG